ncbi:MAG: enoyl-CoA hydratase/isomerase family protein [Acidimicrobiales bacterium]
MPAALVEPHGATAVLRLTTDANAVDTSFLDDIGAALDRIESDDSLTAVVTVGAGKSFSTGFDLDHIMGLGDGATAFLDRAQDLLARLVTFSRPTVAALNGHAFGYGAMLALAHDQRAMRADRGWFCLPEVDLGLQLHAFWTALLTTRAGDATALEAITTARRYDGPAAVEAGIAASAHAEADLLDAAIALAEARAGKDPAMVRTLKQDLYAPLLSLLEG